MQKKSSQMYMKKSDHRAQVLLAEKELTGTIILDGIGYLKNQHYLAKIQTDFL